MELYTDEERNERQLEQNGIHVHEQGSRMRMQGAEVSKVDEFKYLGSTA